MPKAMIPDGPHLAPTLKRCVRYVPQQKALTPAITNDVAAFLAQKLDDPDLAGFKKIMAQSPVMKALMNAVETSMEAGNAAIKTTATLDAGPTAPAPGRRKPGAPQFNA